MSARLETTDEEQLKGKKVDKERLKTKFINIFKQYWNIIIIGVKQITIHINLL